MTCPLLNSRLRTLYINKESLYLLGMWEEGIICLFILLGGFCILPSNIQKQLLSKHFITTIIVSICLYLFSVYILGLYRKKTEQFVLMTGCGPSGNRCTENTPYCLITEKPLPTNQLDQTLLFNTYGRYVKIFPPATEGDGWVGISSLEIFDETGTNILKGKAVSSVSNSQYTDNPNLQGKFVGDFPGQIRYGRNIFFSQSNDRNTVVWEVDLGQVYMITKIRYIGRGDANDSLHVGLIGNAAWQNIPRIIGVRFRIYRNATDVPTTGSCVANPAILYPTGTTDAEKPILDPIILGGMNGQIALRVYRGIQSNPGTVLTSYGLTDQQAAKAYVQMANANNSKKSLGWNIFGTWAANSNEISVISGAMPIVGQTIFSSNVVTVYKTYTGEKEVYMAVGSYTRAEAETKCTSYGATLATVEQLKDAQAKGAGWCAAGWLADDVASAVNTGVGGYPNQIGTCNQSNTTITLGNWSKDGKHHTVCYGVKPPQNTPNILAFNEGGTWNGTTYSASWNMPTYTNDTKGTPERIYPIQANTRITAVNGRRITLDTKIVAPGNNIGIKLNGYQTPQWLANQNILLRSVNALNQLPGSFNREQTIKMYKEHNISSASTFSAFTTDASGNTILDTTKTQYDDGSIHTLNIIMSTTKAVMSDPFAGDSANVYIATPEDKLNGYNIPDPKDTSTWTSTIVSTTSNPPTDITNTNPMKRSYSINDQLDLTGENTYDSSETDLADAAAAQNLLAGNTTGQGEHTIAGRTQLTELMLIGDSSSFATLAAAQAACEEMGGTLATKTDITNEFNNTNPFLKRPQWHHWGFVSDSTNKFILTQQSSLALPLLQETWKYDPAKFGGSYGNGVTDIKRVGGLIERNIGTGGAICKAIKPSLVPRVKIVSAGISPGYVNCPPQCLSENAPKSTDPSWSVGGNVLNCDITYVDDSSILDITYGTSGQLYIIDLRRAILKGALKTGTLNSWFNYTYSRSSADENTCKLNIEDDFKTVVVSDYTSSGAQIDRVMRVRKYGSMLFFIEPSTFNSIIQSYPATPVRSLIEQIRIKKSGRYVRVWPPIISFTPATNNTCSDSSYTVAPWLKTVCVNNTNNRLKLSQVVIRNKEGINIGLGRGTFVKAVYGDENGTYSGNPDMLVDGNETIGNTSRMWMSKQYLACPRGTTEEEFRNNGNGSTYQSTNICQAELYWQIDLGTSQYIESVTLFGCECNSIDGLRVEVSNSLRPKPYSNDRKKWQWNDKAAFNPICPSPLKDKICNDPTTKIPDMKCVPNMTGLDVCPGDCEPGSTWCAAKCKCIMDLSKPNAWYTMEIKQIKSLDASGNLISDTAYQAKVKEALNDGIKKWVDFFMGMAGGVATFGSDVRKKSCQDYCDEGDTWGCGGPGNGYCKDESGSLWHKGNNWGESFTVWKWPWDREYCPRGSTKANYGPIARCIKTYAPEECCTPGTAGCQGSGVC